MTGKLDWLNNARMDPIQKLIKHLGSNAEVARRFEISREAVRQWYERGIPTDRALDIEEMTDGEVTATEILKAARRRKQAA